MMERHASPSGSSLSQRDGPEKSQWGGRMFQSPRSPLLCLRHGLRRRPAHGHRFARKRQVPGVPPTLGYWAGRDAGRGWQHACRHSWRPHGIFCFLGLRGRFPNSWRRRPLHFGGLVSLDRALGRLMRLLRQQGPGVGHCFATAHVVLAQQDLYPAAAHAENAEKNTLARCRCRQAKERWREEAALRLDWCIGVPLTSSCRETRRR